jgi:two-component system, OmpR family, sensor kinase
MSLTARLSLFFLTALAVVLVGFSATLYVLAQRYLERQVDERLTAALDLLEAEVDREPDGLDWDAHDKGVALGRENGLEVVRWQVSSASKRLGCSPNLVSPALRNAMIDAVDEIDQGITVCQVEGQAWQVGWRRIHADTVITAGKEVGTPRQPSLVLLAGLALEPMHDTLRRLLLTLGGLSAGVWLTAALAGRWVCSRALAPVTRMAAAAGKMGAVDLSRRLPDPGTRDQLCVQWVAGPA